MIAATFRNDCRDLPQHSTQLALSIAAQTF
jgi:hypothetical protein